MGVKKKIYNCLPERIKIALFKMKDFDKSYGYGEIYSVTLNNAFDTFLTPAEKSDKRLIAELTDDIVKCWIRYRALPYEYFLFDFRNRSDAERGEFETDLDRLWTLNRVANLQLYKDEIKDKYNFYQLAKPFFKREAIMVNSSEQLNDFVAFVKKHIDVFVKPLNCSKGKGTHVYSYIDEDNAVDYCKELLKEGPSWMVEERVRQSAVMGQWNETSVNTIRIPSFLRDGNFTVIWTRMRMGNKGAIVDNAAAGGIVVNVDPATGVVTSDGIDESFNHYECHPGCGLAFKGWQVPRWQELLETVEKLHRDVFDRHVYVAWDFALTDDGWVLIEGNWGQLLGQQTASQVGVRKQFHELVGDFVK